MTIIVKCYKTKEDKIIHLCGNSTQKKGTVFQKNNYFFCDRCHQFVPKAIIIDGYKKLGKEYKEPEVKKTIPKKKRRRTRRKK